jgi:hypothetical protein
MKKAKRIIAALMSAVMTAALSVSLTANAIISITPEEKFAELLEGNGYPYSKIEDASAIEVQDYSIKSGSVYYVNELGRVIAVRHIAPCIVISVKGTENETRVYEAVKAICPEARAACTSNLNNIIQVKNIHVAKDTGDAISLEKAQELYAALKDYIVGFDYHEAYYTTGYPQYSWREDTDGKKRQHFTTYWRVNDKKDEIQAFIDENALPCHIEEIDDETLDVVMDTEMTFLEEIDVASKITNATGVKCMWCIAETADIQMTGSEIDLYGSVSGDANCDKQMDMSDVVLIMQSLANPDKYKLSAQGCYNADVNGGGITVGDAQAIQNQLLGIN